MCLLPVSRANFYVGSAVEPRSCEMQNDLATGRPVGSIPVIRLNDTVEALCQRVLLLVSACRSLPGTEDEAHCEERRC